MKKNNFMKFPYVKYERSTELGKDKYPHFVDSSIVKVYKNYGWIIENSTVTQEEYRFNTKEVKIIKPSGEKSSNIITISKPSSEIICLRQASNSNVTEMALVLQPRVPYEVEIWNGKNYVRYVRFFIEQPAGLLDKEESFEEAAIRIVEEETGYVVEKIRTLIDRIICRHVSYTDEASKIFVVKLGEKINSIAKPKNDIEVKWFSIEEIKSMQKTGELAGSIDIYFDMFVNLLNYEY